MVGSKGIIVVREDFLGKFISINGFMQCDVGIGVVFWSFKSLGVDVEVVGIVDNLVDSYLCVRCIEEFVDKCIDLLQFIDFVFGKVFVGFMWLFMCIDVSDVSFV